MQTKTYRQGFGVSLLYFIRSIILMAIALLSILTFQYIAEKNFINSRFLMTHPIILSNDFAFISSAIIGILYMWVSLSISVQIANDHLIIKRCFFKRIDVDIWTTKIKVIETSTRSVNYNGVGNFFRNTLSPKYIKIVVVNPDSSKTKINATGIGVNNATMLRELLQMYSEENTTTPTILMTDVSCK